MHGAALQANGGNPTLADGGNGGDERSVQDQWIGCSHNFLLLASLVGAESSYSDDFSSAELEHDFSDVDEFVIQFPPKMVEN